MMSLFTGLFRISSVLLALATCSVIGNTHVQPGSECPRPESIENGGYRLTHDGLRVEYECRRGFIAVGNPSAVCSARQWSRSPPLCVATGCEPVQPMKHGYIELSYGGAIAKFRCEDGYRLKGPAVIVCNGHEWNGTQADCLSKYPQKSLNEHKKYHGKSNDAFHKPKKLYGTGGTEKTHEQWLDEADYTCISHHSSVPPPSVPHAIGFTKWVIMDGMPRLYTVYRCKWGFVPVTKVNNLYCQNGQWTGAKPKCVMRAEPGQALAYNFQGDDSKPGSSSHEDWLRYADYSCFNTRTKEVTAPEVRNARKTPRHAVIDGMPHLYVQYKCNSGYSIAGGSGYMYCKKQNWEGDLPTCVRTSNHRIDPCTLGNGGCEQICISTNGHVRCECMRGYEMNYDRRTCTDIDECQHRNGGCAHLCINTQGSYQCACHDGFILDTDKHSCSTTKHVAGDGEKIPPLVLFHH